MLDEVQGPISVSIIVRSIHQFSDTNSTHPGDDEITLCAKDLIFEFNCNEMRQMHQNTISKYSLPAPHIQFPCVLTSLDLLLACKRIEEQYNFDCWGCTRCEPEYMDEGEQSLV